MSIVNRGSRLWLAILVSIATSLVTPSHAADREALFQEGLSAFHGGDYRTAVARFTSARAAGLDSAALHYNLGVSHYRLADYTAAKAAFERVGRYAAMRDLAHYNLGLVAIKQNDTDAARAWLQRAIRADGEPKLNSLARYQLDRLTESTAVREPLWLADLSVAAGYDDNLADPDRLAVSSEGDSFLEGYGIVRGTLLGRSRAGLLLTVSGYGLTYSQLTDYDMSLIQGGLALTAPFGRGQSEAGVAAETSTLGDQDYLQATHAHLAAETSPSHPITLSVRVRASQFTTAEPAYEPLQGSRQQFRLATRWRQPANASHLIYEGEWNARDDLHQAGTFTSYSPTRHGARMLLELEPSASWTVEAEAGYRRSNYNDPNLLANGSVVTREDDRFQAALRARHPLNPRWRMTLDYQYTDNQSNIATYTYQRNLVSLGLSTHLP